MHDEFERALGVRRRPGLSFLGWIGVGVLTLTVLGATGAFLAYRTVSQEVREIVERVQIRAPAEAPGMVAHTVARTLGEMGTTRTVDEGQVASALARAFSVSGGSVSRRDVPDRAASAPAASGREDAGAVDGGLTQAAEPGAPEAESAREASGDEEVEGFLRIRTDEGEIRAELRAGEDVGRLVVRGADGAVLVDLAGDAGGARLHLRGEGEVASFRTGEHADGPPGWVPDVGGAMAEGQRVLSGRAGEGTFGAETWRTDVAPEALVARFRERLEAEGWEIRAEHGLRDREGVSVSVVASHEGRGRVAVLTAGREDGATRVVLGWGQEAGSP